MRRENPTSETSKAAIAQDARRPLPIRAGMTESINRTAERPGLVPYDTICSVREKWLAGSSFEEMSDEFKLPLQTIYVICKNRYRWKARKRAQTPEGQKIPEKTIKPNDRIDHPPGWIPYETIRNVLDRIYSGAALETIKAEFGLNSMQIFAISKHQYRRGGLRHIPAPDEEPASIESEQKPDQ
jgi:hypothetical protein